MSNQFRLWATQALRNQPKNAQTTRKLFAYLALLDDLADQVKLEIIDIEQAQKSFLAMLNL